MRNMTQAGHYVLLFLLMLGLSACSPHHNDNDNEPANPVVRISVTHKEGHAQGVKEPRVALGGQVQYEATVYYRDGSHSVMTDGLEWRATNEMVSVSPSDIVKPQHPMVSVSPSGVVTPRQPGKVVIEATMDGITGVSEVLTVTDAVVTAIQITPATVNLARGHSQALTAIATYSDQTSADITRIVDWSSANPAIASVSPMGVMTGLTTGATSVNASFDGVISNSAAVTVTDAVVTAIQVTPAVVNLAKGNSQSLTAIATYSDQSSSDISSSVIWISVNPSIATVTPAGLVAAVGVGSTTLSASFNGITSNTATVTVTDAVVTALQITPATVNLAKGNTQALMAMATYSDQTNRDISSSVIWISANPSIATVTPAGLVAAVGVGSTTLSASFNGITSNSAAVTVTDAVVTALQITPATVSLAKGNNQTLTAMATYSDQSSADISTVVAWSSADTSVATVTPAGLMTGVGVGSTSVTATFNDVTSNTATVTVTDAVVTAIQITPATVSLAKGNNQALTAMATYSDQSSADISSVVAWSSADTSVATVTPAGLMTGVGVGSSSVTATFNGVTSNTATVTVTDAVVTALQITPATVSLAKGNTQALMAMATYSDQTSADITSSVNWSSADTSIATVTPAGLVAAVGVGSSTVTATFNGITSNSAAVTVTDAVVTALQITPATVSLAKGNNQALMAMATYSDQSSADITSSVIWSSADTSIATVTPAGLVSAVGVGSTTVTATFNGITSNTATVTVTDAVVTALQITPATVSLTKGNHQALMAMATYSDQSSADITSTVAWSSANTGIATVTSAGLMAGVGVGSTTVTASIHGITSNAAAVMVTDAVVTAIAVSPTPFSLAKGNHQAMIAMATYSDQSSADISSSVTWSSANTGIATVTPAGLVSAVGVGSSTVTASFNGVTSNAAAVTVTDAVVTAIVVSPTSVSLAKGNHQSMIAMATYSDQSSADISSTVSWSSANTGIATVTSAGQVTGVGVGSATLSASINGVTSNTAAVTVTDAVVTAIQVTPASPSLTRGSSQNLTAMATYSDQTSADISSSVAWSSANTGIATVTPAGLMAGVGVGSTTVTASSNGVTSNTAAITVTSAGRVVTWGLAANGGDSSAVQAQLTDVLSIVNSRYAFAALKADGTVVTWGNTSSGGDSSAVQSQLTNVQSIASSDSAFAAIKADGTVVTWGNTSSGGDSSAVQPQLVNVQRVVSNDNAFAALKADGSVVAWGTAANGGDSSPVQSQLTNIKAIVGSRYAFAALKVDGAVVGWGTPPRAGPPTDPAPIDIAEVQLQLTGIQSIFSNGFAFAALKTDGSVVTWGTREYGGDSSAVQAQLTHVQSVVGAANAFAVLKRDGTVVTWGDASKGGDSSMVQPLLTNVQSIFTNGGAFAALKADGTVVTWGDTTYGDSSAVQSQLTQVQTIVTNAFAFAVLKADGTVVTWGPDWGGGDSSTVQPQLTNVQSIFASDMTFAALKADGTVVTWGSATVGGDSSAVQSQLVNVQTITGGGHAFAAIIDGP